MSRPSTRKNLLHAVLDTRVQMHVRHTDLVLKLRQIAVFDVQR